MYEETSHDNLIMRDFPHIYDNFTLSGSMKGVVIYIHTYKPYKSMDTMYKCEYMCGHSS